MIYFKSRVCTYLGHLKLPSTHCSQSGIVDSSAPINLLLMHICFGYTLLDLKHLALREMMASLAVFSCHSTHTLVYWLTVLCIACLRILSI